MQKLFIMGLGSVGKSFLNLVLKEKLFDIKDIYIIDRDSKSFSFYTERGGDIKNCHNIDVNSLTRFEIFEMINEDDFLVDLVNGINNSRFTDECLSKGIHYISTCDDAWEEEEHPDFQFNYNTFQKHLTFFKVRQYDYKNKNTNTSIIQFGMNPGLVSIFVKKALIDIVNEDTGAFVAENRNRLKELIEKNKFNELAMELKVRDITEIDLDTSDTNLKGDFIYSTWNVTDFIVELNENPIVKVGTNSSLKSIMKKFNLKYSDIIKYDGENTLVLNVKARDVKKGISFKGNNFDGFLVSHEEIFSLYDYFSVFDNNMKLIYAPNVYFLYKPCNLASSSLEKEIDELKYKIIQRGNITSGGESVGVIISGDNFKTRYVGNYLNIKDTTIENPTILQVSAGVLSALKYILNNPNEGLLLPENLDTKEILEYALSYLKSIESFEID